ncbi:MAG: MarR family winged helix-turn-helix transcriptional regulator [Acidimicrobiales bacterium]
MTETRWLEPEEQRAWRAWLAMSELLRSQIGRDLQAEAGLSEPDLAVLVHLSESPDHQMRMTDLAERLRWSKSRLSHQVGRMEARGLLRREGCPSDARGSFAMLTSGGVEEIRRAAPAHVASVRRHLIDVLDAGQLEQLTLIAERLAEHALAEGEPATCSGLPVLPEGQGPGSVEAGGAVEAGA